MSIADLTPSTETVANCFVGASRIGSIQLSNPSQSDLVPGFELAGFPKNDPLDLEIAARQIECHLIIETLSAPQLAEAKRLLLSIVNNIENPEDEGGRWFPQEAPVVEGSAKLFLSALDSMPRSQPGDDYFAFQNDED